MAIVGGNRYGWFVIEEIPDLPLDNTLRIGLCREADGSVIPFPKKFPGAAAAIRAGVDRGLLEVANHGYTHCVLQDGLFRSRLFSGNRTYHREFHEWLPADVHRDHLKRAQDILEGFLGRPVVTFVPPGNVFAAATLEAAAAAGIRYVSCLNAHRAGPVPGITFVDDGDVVSIHDRDIVHPGAQGRVSRLEGRPAGLNRGE